MQIVYNIFIGLMTLGILAVVAGMVMTLISLVRRKDTARDRTRVGSFVILGGLALATLATTVLLAIAPQLR